MSDTLPERPQESGGEDFASTLPDSTQAELFAPVTLDIRTFLRRALRNHLKEAATFAFPNTPVERALIDLCRVLEAKSNRHLEAEWMRLWAKQWPWFKTALAHYWAGDCGFVAIPKLDPKQERERLDALAGEVQKVGRNLEVVARQLAEIKDAREGRR